MAQVVKDKVDYASMDPALALEASELARQSCMDETTARGDSSVQRFYDGAVVLVTGGTGFLGKQLIEKLFRSCNISKVYMLVRLRKGKSVQQRIETIVQDSVFERLSKVKPDFPNKIFPIAGDITQKGLGITQEDRDRITNEVTVIFHGAATISFTEPLKLATLTNVRGTCEMLALGKACKNLKAYVQISTAYSHATYDRVNKPVLEKFYESPISPTALVELAETVDEKILDDMTPEFINNWPNTYSFTKSVAEEAVRTMSEDLPVCIVRPAVVIAALREPSPGWIDRSCVFGPSGYLVGGALGAVHAMHTDPDTCLDFVPVDYVNNASIIAAKETACRKKHHNDIKIYTVTGIRNPLSMGELLETLEIIDAENVTCSSDKVLWSRFLFYTKYKFVFLLMHFVFHLIPAYLADVVLQMFGKRPVAVKLCNLLVKFSSVYEYYLHNVWAFDDKNLTQLYFNLSPADRLIFECNSTNVYWKLYLNLWMLGLRKYVIKDGLNNSQKAKRKMFWFKIANVFVLPTYLFILSSVFYGLVTTVFKTTTFFGFSLMTFMKFTPLSFTG